MLFRLAYGTQLDGPQVMESTTSLFSTLRDAEFPGGGLGGGPGHQTFGARNSFVCQRL